MTDPETHSDTPTTWQGRVVLERDELADRLAKLKAFLDTEAFFHGVSGGQQVLMWTQAGLMQGYLNVLNKRLEIGR